MCGRNGLYCVSCNSTEYTFQLCGKGEKGTLCIDIQAKARKITLDTYTKHFDISSLVPQTKSTTKACTICYVSKLERQLEENARKLMHLENSRRREYGHQEAEVEVTDSDETETEEEADADDDTEEDVSTEEDTDTEEDVSTEEDTDTEERTETEENTDTESEAGEETDWIENDEESDREWAAGNESEHEGSDEEI